MALSQLSGGVEQRQDQTSNDE
ncbi:hypothetical protein UM538_05240 [Staphylococcus aureus]|nr:hypothetical protein UM538_05240 [Staphylococcus aureus]